MGVHHEHLGRALEHRRMGRHQSDRAGAVDRDRLAGQKASQFGRVPSGREDVGQHHVVVLLLRRVVRKDETVEVGIGHPQQFRLAALIGAHLSETECGAGGPRIAGQAKPGQSALAVLAKAAADVEREADPVALLHAVHSAANLDHLAEILVAEDASLFETRPSFVHVQVGAADVRRGEAHENVRGLLDLGIGNLVDADVARTLVNDSLHFCCSLLAWPPSKNVVAPRWWPGRRTRWRAVARHAPAHPWGGDAFVRGALAVTQGRAIAASSENPCRICGLWSSKSRSGVIGAPSIISRVSVRPGMTGTSRIFRPSATCLSCAAHLPPPWPP